MEQEAEGQDGGRKEGNGGMKKGGIYKAVKKTRT